jgi:predicted nucleic acid-binding protein
VNVYVDSSVLLAVVLGEPTRLRAWNDIRHRIASEIIRVECLRTIDRARLRLGVSDRAFAQRRAAVLEQLQFFSLVPIDATVLERAADPFPTALGSLAALHLASALAVRTQIPDLRFATHDAELGTAARAVGFAVMGATVD